MAASRVSIDGPKKSPSRASSASGGTDKKKVILLSVAGVCLLTAAGVTAWNMGMFGSSQKSAPMPQDPILTVPEPQRPALQKELKLQAEQASKAKSSGS